MMTQPQKKQAADKMEDGLKKQDSQPHQTQERPDEESGSILQWVKNLLPGKPSGEDALRDAIEELIEEDDNTPQSAVAQHERKLISNILDLRDLPVVDVMVPRADISAIDIRATKDDLYALLAEKPHTRVPVYKDNLDNIVGVINMKDLVANIAAGGGHFEIKDIMRDAMVVSPAMRVMDLILQMRQSKVHIAFVVDEFGGIDGLITINDLIEAIVGEIDDEFEFEATPQILERPDGSIIADARFDVELFEERYGNVFSEDEENEEADTLGGLVAYLAGHVPARGEVVRHQSGIEFEVIDGDPRRVTRLRIRNLPQKVETPAE